MDLKFEKQNYRQMKIKQGHKRTQSNSEFDFESLKNKPQELHLLTSNCKNANSKYFTSSKKSNNLTQRIMQIQEKQ
jgi:hypothetical protein